MSLVSYCGFFVIVGFTVSVTSIIDSQRYGGEILPQLASHILKWLPMAEATHLLAEASRVVLKSERFTSACFRSQHIMEAIEVAAGIGRMIIQELHGTIIVISHLDDKYTSP